MWKTGMGAFWLVVYWTGYFVLLYPLWVTLVQKLKTVSLS